MTTQLAEGITFRGTVDEQAIIDKIASKGIAVLEDFLSESEVAATWQSVEALLGQRHQGDFAPNRSRIKRLRKQDLAAALEDPALGKNAERPIVQNCRRSFFDPYRSRFDALYIMHYVDETPANEKYHSDGTPTLKLLIYLSDVDENNGTFWYDVGSHREGYFRMMCNFYEGRLVGATVPDDEVRNPVAIVGKQGTAILFNTLGIHRAGLIRPGYERLTITYFFNSAERNFPAPKVLRRICGKQITNLWKYNAAHQSLEYYK
jgi:ectoine hydroxylase-related dioxygenase (phytanoyl-CoA dioxygenase family)